MQPIHIAKSNAIDSKLYYNRKYTTSQFVCYLLVVEACVAERKRDDKTHTHMHTIMHTLREMNEETHLTTGNV